MHFEHNLVYFESKHFWHHFLPVLGVLTLHLPHNLLASQQLPHQAFPGLGGFIRHFEQTLEPAEKHV